MSTKEHWESVYQSKEATRVSWYAPHLELSLALLERASCGSRTARLIDVGGGASTLVDDLLALGHERVTVLDLSAEALEIAKRRMGNASARVAWLVGDVTTIGLPEGGFDVWHDRAVFHFLTDPAARALYVAQVKRALRPGGFAVVATFGPHGPETCSGFDVMRYDAEGLHGEFGPSFEKLDSAIERHKTPWGTEQEFVYCLCRT